MTDSKKRIECDEARMKECTNRFHNGAEGYWHGRTPNDPAGYWITPAIYKDVQALASQARKWLRMRMRLLEEHDRAVELLRGVISNTESDVWGQPRSKFLPGEEWEIIFDLIKAFLRELEGGDRDHEGADGTGKIEENK